MTSPIYETLNITWKKQDDFNKWEDEIIEKMREALR